MPEQLQQIFISLKKSWQNISDVSVLCHELAEGKTRRHWDGNKVKFSCSLQRNSDQLALASSSSCRHSAAITADQESPRILGSPTLIAFRSHSYWLLSHLPFVFGNDVTFKGTFAGDTSRTLLGVYWWEYMIERVNVGPAWRWLQTLVCAGSLQKWGITWTLGEKCDSWC